MNYTPLGNGTAAGSNWTLTGLNLPTGQNFYIRARGYYRSGYQNGSESITESVRNAFLLPEGAVVGGDSGKTTVPRRLISIYRSPGTPALNAGVAAPAAITS